MVLQRKFASNKIMLTSPFCFQKWFCRGNLLRILSIPDPTRRLRTSSSGSGRFGTQSTLTLATPVGFFLTYHFHSEHLFPNSNLHIWTLCIAEEIEKYCETKGLNSEVWVPKILQAARQRCYYRFQLLVPGRRSKANDKAKARFVSFVKKLEFARLLRNSRPFSSPFGHLGLWNPNWFQGRFSAAPNKKPRIFREKLFHLSSFLILSFIF